MLVNISKHCEMCDLLTTLLEQERHEKSDILRRLLELTTPAQPQSVIPGEAPKPIMPRIVPWRIKQQMLEEEDRAKARILAEQRNINSKNQMNVDIKVAPADVPMSSFPPLD